MQHSCVFYMLITNSTVCVKATKLATLKSCSLLRVSVCGKGSNQLLSKLSQNKLRTKNKVQSFILLLFISKIHQTICCQGLSCIIWQVILCFETLKSLRQMGLSSRESRLSIISSMIQVFIYTNGLYSRNPGFLFALDKGLKSVNCSNYPKFIRKAAFYPRKTFPPLTVYVIKDTKNSNLLFE